jgi:hypothetical protein
MSNMNLSTQNGNRHPIMFAVKHLINKLLQNPEVYPIRYYKKTNRLKRSRRTMMW